MQRDPRLHILDAPITSPGHIVFGDEECSNGAHLYVACIYVRSQNCYDIHIMIAGTSCDIPAGDGAGLVRILWRRSHRYVSLPKLCVYMNRKFRNCKGPHGTYLSVHNSLDWIESIIAVEFDFHVGDADCRRLEHTEMLIKYCRDVTAGWYIDDVAPTLPASTLPASTDKKE